MAPSMAARSLLIGTGASYLYSMLALHATLFASLGDASAAFLLSVLSSAAVAAAAWCVGFMLAGGGHATQALLFVTSVVFHGIALPVVAELGFFAAASYTMLAAGVVMAAKLYDRTDDRFHIVKHMIMFIAFGLTGSLLKRDLGNGSCFFAVMVLAVIVYRSDLQDPAVFAKNIPAT